MNGLTLRTRRGMDGLELELAFDHPMESGDRADAQGTRIPPWFLVDVALRFDARLLGELTLGPAVSRNPVITFALPSDLGGGVLEATWRDNRGATGTRRLSLELPNKLNAR